MQKWPKMIPAMYKSRSRHETQTLHVQVYPVVIEEPSPAFLKRKFCIVFPDCDVGHLLAVLCTSRGAVRLTPKAAMKTHRHPSGSTQSLGSCYRRPQWKKMMSGSLETQSIILFNSAPPFAISCVTVKTPRPQISTEVVLLSWKSGHKWVS